MTLLMAIIFYTLTHLETDRQTDGQTGKKCKKGERERESLFV